VHAEAYSVVECLAAGMTAPVRTQLPKGDYAGQYQWGLFARKVRGLPVSEPAALADPVYGVRLLDAIGRSCQSGREVLVAADKPQGVSAPRVAHAV
jgi:hypothetical protein